MIKQQRILIVDEGGVMRYEYSTTDNPFTIYSISNQLFTGMISAINSLARELGGALQIIVLGTEKIASRYIQLKNKQLLLLVADAYNTRDDLLLLKTEIFVRRLYPFFLSESEIPQNKFNPFHMTIAHMETQFNKAYFHKILTDNSPKSLLNAIKGLESPNDEFENMLNFLLKELPTGQILADPTILIIENSSIVVPLDLRKENKERIIAYIKEFITPIVGERFINIMFKRFSIPHE